VAQVAGHPGTGTVGMGVPPYPRCGYGGVGRLLASTVQAQAIVRGVILRRLSAAAFALNQRVHDSPFTVTVGPSRCNQSSTPGVGRTTPDAREPASVDPGGLSGLAWVEHEVPTLAPVRTPGTVPAWGGTGLPWEVTPRQRPHAGHVRVALPGSEAPERAATVHGAHPA